MQTFAHRNLPALLLQAREALMARRRPALRRHGLSDQQWRVLRVLAEAAGAAHTRVADQGASLNERADCGVDGGIETGALAKGAFILGPSLTGILARMERDGLVVRKRSTRDARRFWVAASPKGLALVGALSVEIEFQYQEVSVHLGAERLTELYAMLDDLIEMKEGTDVTEA